MADFNTSGGSDLMPAFQASERLERINTGKVASALVVFLMPAGVVLDWFVHRDQLGFFLLLRLVCSGLAGVLWYLHTTNFGERHYKILGMPIAWLPAFFIGWMIHEIDRTTGTDAPDTASGYYAGLNLILLAISIVVRWNVRESLLAVAGVLLIYSLAVLPYAGRADASTLFNNYYFLILTGIIVVTGNYFFNQLRFREFATRYQLNLSRRDLETSNEQLSQKKGQLESALEELKQTQDQLVTREKQASLGVWSAGIIHEMNNPLNFARTGLYALRNTDKHLPESERAEFKEIVADVEEGIKRVHTIVSDLRTYAHPGRGEENEAVPVADVVRMALRFLSAEMQDGVELVQNISPDQTVPGNRNKLIQVLGNLLQNSVDALKSKTFDAGHPTITIESRVQDGRSQLTVHDNGPGTLEEHLDKVFDPFFTTKEVGKGMGLGLGICYKIVQECGGNISVRTEPGQFCEFTLDFPVEGKQESQS
jgi:two-component system sensor histidine kinase PhcS